MGKPSFFISIKKFIFLLKKVYKRGILYKRNNDFTILEVTYHGSDH